MELDGNNLRGNEGGDFKSAYLEFRDNYILTHPMPIEPKLTRMQTLGWVFWASAITCAAAMLLAALRTGTWFYLAAASDKSGVLSGWASGTLGFIEALLGVLAYEGILVVLAITLGMSRKSYPRYATWLIIILGLSTSFAAGLGTSFNILPAQYATLADDLRMVLVVLLGLATAMAWFSGELLGYQYKMAHEIIEEARKQYKQDVTDYESALLRSWEANKRRILGAVDNASNRLETAPVALLNSRTEASDQKLSIMELTQKWLEKNEATAFDDDLSPAQIAQYYKKKGVDISPGAVRTSLSRIRAKEKSSHAPMVGDYPFSNSNFAEEYKPNGNGNGNGAGGAVEN